MNETASKLTPEIIERLNRRRARLAQYPGFTGDSTEVLRRSREERSAQLTGEEVDDPPSRIDRLNRIRQTNEEHGWANAPDSTELLRQSRDER